MSVERLGILGRAARFGDFELDLRSAELRKRDGAALRLAEQPFNILLALLEHPQEVVLREELRGKLWPNNTIVEFEHSINASVNRLRRVLEDSAEEPRFIETLARRGYRWLVPVEWIEQPVASSNTVPPAVASPIGRKVSHYRLLEVLGGGGMGVVYKAEDLKLGRHVALKFLGEEFSGDHRAIGRFEREARTLSALDHPNICTIYEVAEHQGHPFLVMQLLQGQTLRQHIESVSVTHAMTLTELLDIAGGILAGLDAAHEKGIIHRDIKPANIFLTARGQVKLLDFGLAKLVADVEAVNGETGVVSLSASDSRPISLTMSGITMGTASYMAPEQVRGQPVDTRTDLFSFGVVLYEMATGRQPFSGATLGAIHEAILTDTPPSPRGLNRELPTELDAVIERLLQKDPERRYQSAREVIERLELLRPPATGASETPSSTAQVGTPRRMRPILGAIAIALVIIALGAWLVVKWTPTASPAEHLEIRKLTDSGRVENVAISRDARYLAYTQQEINGVALWLRRLADGRETLLLPPSDVASFRGLSFSPAGDMLYFVRADANAHDFRYLYVIPASGGPVRQLVKDIDSPVGFSPDGERFVYTRGIPSNNSTEIRIADADGGANRLLATVPDTFPGYQPGPTWSPDGRAIAVPLLHLQGAPPYALYKVDALSGAVTELISGAYSIGRALWLPSGHGFVLMIRDSEFRGRLWAVAYPSLKSQQLSSDLTDYDGRADITADGRELVTTANATYANLWTASAADGWSGRELTTLSVPLRNVIEAPEEGLLATSIGHVWRFSPDGRQRQSFTALDNASGLTRCGPYVIVMFDRNAGTEFVRFNADGSGPMSLIAGGLALPVCSPDEKYLYYLDFGPPEKIWRIAITGGQPQEIAAVLGDAIASRISISADGKSIAYAYSEFSPIPKTRFVLAPVAGGPPQRLLDLPGAAQLGSQASAMLTPDGRSVAYVVTENGISNVWQQALDGGGHRRLTHFTSGQIFDFNWDREGKTLLLSRGEVSRDAVLLTHLQTNLER